MGYIRYRQARTANKVAKRTERHVRATAQATQQQAAAAARPAAEPMQQLTPEQTVRQQTAIHSRGWIDKQLKAAGFRNAEYRRTAYVQVVRLVGDGETIEEAVQSVIRWTQEANGSAPALDS